jgi:protein-tyrosine phosphatase
MINYVTIATILLLSAGRKNTFTFTAFVAKSFIMEQILFLCTGNYYRSRFAELFFNHLADKNDLEWRAISRALAMERGACNVGPISSDAVQGLRQRGVILPDVHRTPLQLQDSDLETSTRIIALHEPEHRPLIEQRFPAWAQQVEYWCAPDNYDMHPDQAMDYIAEQVSTLMSDLKNRGNLPPGA